MSTATEAVREQLMANNAEFRRLHEQHAGYAAQLDQLKTKNYFTEQDKLEEIRLKKLKLRIKDQMEILVRQTRPV